MGQCARPACKEACSVGDIRLTLSICYPNMILAKNKEIVAVVLQLVQQVIRGPGSLIGPCTDPAYTPKHGGVLPKQAADCAGAQGGPAIKLACWPAGCL